MPLRLRSLTVLAASLLVALGATASAAADTRAVTYRAGPFDLGSFETARPKVIVRSPPMNGSLTEMHARVVDSRGTPVSMGDVMLHHVIFINQGRFPGDRRTQCGSRFGEPFYGTGEENQALRLPPGYGYRLRRGDRWKMQTMLMSHSAAQRRVWVEYRMSVVKARLRPVVPYWLRVTDCRAEPSYSISGGFPPGALHTRTSTWVVPQDGRIVAAGGHLHGGARDLTIRQPVCGDRELVRSVPSYGLPEHPTYNFKPLLHEPGPVDTSYFLSAEGVPVRRGEPLQITARYEGERPHTGVMGVMHAYVAPGPVPPEPCPAMPSDVQNLRAPGPTRDDPPTVTIPLNAVVGGVASPIERPAGRLWSWGLPTDRPVVRVTDGRFTKINLDVAAGTRVTWRFDDAVPHKVALANGPRAVGSPTLRRGTWARSFSTPGVYQLFCPLHPMTMHQEIRVRARDPAPPA